MDEDWKELKLNKLKAKMNMERLASIVYRHGMKDEGLYKQCMQEIQEGYEAGRRKDNELYR